MTFIESIKTCFKKYITIKGRAPRSEYWWFQAMFVPLFLFVVIMSEAENLESSSELIIWFYLLCFVIVIISLIPVITVTIRRFHDTNKSGWYFLLEFIPLIGWLIVLAMLIEKGTEGKNRFGDYPLKLKRKQ